MQLQKEAAAWVSLGACKTFVRFWDKNPWEERTKILYRNVKPDEAGFYLAMASISLILTNDSLTTT